MSESSEGAGRASPALTEDAKRIAELEEGYRDILRDHAKTPQSQAIARRAHELVPDEPYDGYGWDFGKGD